MTADDTNNAASRSRDAGFGDGFTGEIGDPFPQDRPASGSVWVTESQLDLRPGGPWSLAFQVPNGPAFREDRVITADEWPHRLDYNVSTVFDDALRSATTVTLAIDAVPDGHRIRLVQQGFPTVEARDDFASVAGCA